LANTVPSAFAASFLLLHSVVLLITPLELLLLLADGRICSGTAMDKKIANTFEVSPVQWLRKKWGRGV